MRSTGSSEGKLEKVHVLSRLLFKVARFPLTRHHNLLNTNNWRRSIINMCHHYNKVVHGVYPCLQMARNSNLKYVNWLIVKGLIESTV